MEAATESVGCSTYALPMVLGYFGKVPKRQEGGLIRNPAYDEEEFKALQKEQQACQQKYLQGPNGSCLREELVVAHEFHHPPDLYRFRVLEPVRKLQSGSGQGHRIRLANL